jgi:hypothetical protein
LEYFCFKKEKLTVEKISEGIKYVEKVLFSTLKRIMSWEMFVKMKKMISENEKNEKIYSSLICFLKMISFRGAGVKSEFLWNSFYSEMRDCGLKEMIENKVKEIVFSEEKKNSEMSECERDLILEYSFLMKNQWIEKELLSKLWKCLILIVKEGISKEKKKEEREGSIGLRYVCEDPGFFLSSFSLFFSFLHLLSIFLLFISSFS